MLTREQIVKLRNLTYGYRPAGLISAGYNSGYAAALTAVLAGEPECGRDLDSLVDEASTGLRRPVRQMFIEAGMQAEGDDQ